MRVLLSVILALSLMSCHFLGMGERVSGNGHIKSQEKDVDNFNSLDVSGQVTVRLRQEGNTSVKIETDENLLPYVETFVTNGTLIIRTKEGYNLDPSKDIVAYVSAPLFKDLNISGQCDIIGDGTVTGNETLSIQSSGQGEIHLDVDFPKIDAHLSGQGNLTLKGDATDFSATVSGQGDVKCFDLITDNTRLDISGQSDVEITVNKRIDIESSGNSSVKYRGTGTIGKNSSSGNSTVDKVN